MLRRIARLIADSGVFWLLGTLLAAGVKLFYSRAGAEQLGFILAPTCRLVELLSGIDFEHERHAGWISHSARLIVGPSCAGLNFAIITFVTLFHSFVHRLHGPRVKALWLVGSVGCAYLLAVGTNALRIVAAIELRAAPSRAAFIAPAQAHRLLGTLIYGVALWLVYRAALRLLARVAPVRGAEPRPTRLGAMLASLVPFLWYALVALGIPLVNGARHHEGAPFAEHAVVVLGVLLVLGASALLERRIRT